MAEEIHRHDPAYRRIAIAIVLGGTAVGAILLYSLLLWLDRIDPKVTRGEEVLGLWALFLALTILIALLLFGLSLAMRRLATRIEAAGRFPPLDMKTLRDQSVRNGSEATAIAQRVRLFGWLVLFCGVAIAAWGAFSAWGLA